MPEVRALRRPLGALNVPWLALLASLPVMLVGLPIIYLVYRGSQAGFYRLYEELFRTRTLELLANTLGLAFGVTAACLALGLLVAWSIERTNIPGRQW